MVADAAVPTSGSTPVDGTLEHRNVRTSIWERPHKITFVGTTDLPFGFRLGFTYIGMSGAAVYLRVAGRSQRGWVSTGRSPCRTMSSTCRGTPATSRWRTRPSSPRSTASFGRSPASRASVAGCFERDSCRDPWVQRDHGAAVEAVSPRGQADARGHRRSLQRAELREQRLGPGPPDLRGRRERRPAAAARRLRHSQFARRLRDGAGLPAARSTWTPRAGDCSSPRRCSSSDPQLSGTSKASKGG